MDELFVINEYSDMSDSKLIKMKIENLQKDMEKLNLKNTENIEKLESSMRRLNSMIELLIYDKVQELYSEESKESKQQRLNRCLREGVKSGIIFPFPFISVHSKYSEKL